MRRGWRAAAALAIAALLLIALPVAAYAEKTVGLSSGSFFFEIDPGETGQGEVVVSNDGDEPIKVLVYVADVEIDETGEQTFVVPQREGASLLTTPASWFSVYMPADSKSVGNTPYVELAVGEQIPIRFEFTPPLGTPAGDHNVIMFFEMFEFAAADGSSAQVSGRLGSRVALRVTGEMVEQVTIRPLEVPQIQIAGEIPFRAVVNNEGNLNERVRVTASVLDRAEEAIASSVVTTDTAIFADSGMEFRDSIVVPGSSFGPHTFEFRVEYASEGDQTAAEVVEQREIWLVPLWVVVLAGFIVVYGLGYLVYRALVRRRERRKAAAARRKSHRERDVEAEERRRRREERAAEAAQAIEGDGAGSADTP